VASSKRPRLRATAPVKAPRSWPKSSLSMSSLGMAAQFTFTKGPLARGERRWIGPGDELLAGAGLAGDEHPHAGLARPC
jgi:hypothetical protein